MEDCTSSGPGGEEVTSFPMWMLGAEESFLTVTARDIARMHAAFANSPELDVPVLAIDHDIEFLQGLDFLPGTIQLVVKHFEPAPPHLVELVGPDAEGKPWSEALNMLLLRKKEVFDFTYIAASDGQTYTLGEGPQEYPAPCMHGEQGKTLLREVCRIMGARKIQTLLHGQPQDCWNLACVSDSLAER